MPIQIKIDMGEVKRGFSNMLRAKLWAPLIINNVMKQLGLDIVPIIKDEIAPHRYLGTLEGSVKSGYDPITKELTVGPDAERGGYDAGEILEFGTRPIKNVPWAKIQAWGEFRGLSPKQIRGAWVVIREKGVQPHPFIDKVVQRGDFMTVLQVAGDRMGRELAAEVFKGAEGNI